MVYSASPSAHHRCHRQLVLFNTARCRLHQRTTTVIFACLKWRYLICFSHSVSFSLGCTSCTSNLTRILITFIFYRPSSWVSARSPDVWPQHSCLYANANRFYCRPGILPNGRCVMCDCQLIGNNGRVQCRIIDILASFDLKFFQFLRKTQNV